MSQILGVKAPRKRRTQIAAFQNCSRQCLKSRARCSDVEIFLQKLMVATRRSPTESRQISGSRIRAHTDTTRSARHQNSINSVYTTENEQESQTTASTICSPIRDTHQILSIPVFWIHFNTL